VIGADVLRELLPLERMVYYNFKTFFPTENVDTFLIDGIGDKNFHKISPVICD
jgi:hypothetical protein